MDNKNLLVESIFKELDIALKKIKFLPINGDLIVTKDIYTYNT